ncbi:hypothetical protein CVV38_03160 [Candidatus Peregrinibacteria bacterium HGW-Peregrinibacteria-1]|jgi:putative membrane protein|nr:MAG: hypothetical protein CVV38_03160 [Candidatus Peregrinibacteria bacterium HGW-Peregrinibacteria-1]
MSIILAPIISIMANGIALYFLTKLVSGISYTGGLTFFIIAAIIVGILNSFVKPALKIFSLPLIALSGGLMLIVINAFILWLLNYIITIIQFQDVTLSFQDTTTYVIGALVFGLINWIINLVIK